MKQVKIPSTVTAIDDRAFFDCDDLNEIQLREGLLSIGESSFSHASLKQIRIPSTVTTIDAYSFAECKTLMEVHLCEGLESTGMQIVFISRSLLPVISILTVILFLKISYLLAGKHFLNASL